MAFYTSILVTFDTPNHGLIQQMLDDLKLRGTQVAGLIPRWMVEVPYGKEAEFATLLKGQELVKTVHPYQKEERRAKPERQQGKRRSA